MGFVAYYPEAIHPNGVVAFLVLIVPSETPHLPRLIPVLADPAVEEAISLNTVDPVTVL